MNWLALAPLATALLAALLALSGNYWLQNRSGRRIRDADEVRRHLYDLLALVTEYWMAKRRDTTLEARVLAATWIVVAELRRMESHSRRLQRWYDDIEAHRLDMIDAATGGCFQQEDWVADSNRVLLFARSMHHILGALRQAC